MNALELRYAELGLKSLVKARTPFDFMYTEDLNSSRLSHRADWEAGTVAFELLADGLLNVELPPLRWTLKLDDESLLDSWGTVGFLARFHDIFPDREVRKPYLSTAYPAEWAAR